MSRGTGISTYWCVLLAQYNKVMLFDYNGVKTDWNELKRQELHKRAEDTSLDSHLGPL